ncbi:unnamed protein product [Urochloa decumbens]|uniref:Uncharacterized protein n=1 Tax=Urochloa decumbens TaxID=240449 RepID=A0ABC9DV82_9POAL
MASSKVKKTESKAKKLPPFPALQLVSSHWALCFACLYAAVAYRAISNQPSSLSPRYRLPPAAAAALALLLPAGRRRRALALAALAAAAVNHGVLARLLGLLRGAAPPGDVLLLTVAALVTCAALVTDLVGFLAILIGGQED